MRISKTDYYLNIAEMVAQRGTCLRRNYGAIIVSTEDDIISTGYTGAPRGWKNCCDLGVCRREELNIAHGERYELCRSVHAEANAIINASKHNMQNATLYLVGIDAKTLENVDAECCLMCQRLVANAGIEKVIAKQKRGYKVFYPKDWQTNDTTKNKNIKETDDDEWK